MRAAERRARERRHDGLLDRVSPVYAVLAVVVLATAVLAAVLTPDPLVRLVIVAGSVVASCAVARQLWRQVAANRPERRS